MFKSDWIPPTHYYKVSLITVLQSYASNHRFWRLNNLSITSNYIYIVQNWIKPQVVWMSAVTVSLWPTCRLTWCVTGLGWLLSPYQNRLNPLGKLNQFKSRPTKVKGQSNFIILSLSFWTEAFYSKLYLIKQLPSRQSSVSEGRIETILRVLLAWKWHKTDIKWPPDKWKLFEMV